jgi:DNA repair exonuclease SbcCD nuclease subunit
MAGKGKEREMKDGGMREIRLVHSSDLHVEDDDSRRGPSEDGTYQLGLALRTARALGADVVLLAGDTFDHGKVKAPVLERTAALIGGMGVSVVMLPGNHDPALSPSSIFHRCGLVGLPDVHILGITHDEAVHFAQFDLEVWGHAHRDYGDTIPLRGPRPRSTRWQVAMAHGHYEAPPDWDVADRPSFRFNDEEIAATSADYLAVGHWDRPFRIGDGRVPAYYSGCPDLAKTVNLVRLCADGEVIVTREPILTNL